ncbi:ATP-dependent DNA helicase RecG [Psychromicrobium lacuslunae]|uniref:ATP-dependent DNA helicase RecG n=1 Tax=Psychromicrobium lacuslunae TaxID=1618207 RepID=A0A0D4BYR3_9MICC|nr:ATP-dependent DNA helicase RecG [Psychromicrobium lacuslunae]AJT41241.1 ATP-dependent DNA helicase RecG [Psychromicrobium lacuslunae]
MTTRTAEGALPLERLLGKASATALEKYLGLRTVAELLNYFPRRYLNRGELTPISGLPFDEDVTLIARVLSVSNRRMRQRKGSITDVVISDDTSAGTGTLKISFFNGWRAEKELRPGARAMFSGKVGFFNRALTLTNPDYVLLDDEGTAESVALAPIPVYPAVAKLPSWKIGNAISALLDAVQLDALSDPLPAEILSREKFLALDQAYLMIHRPANTEQWQRARDRFRYQEALLLQTALARRRAQTKAQHAVARPGLSDGLLAAFDAALPFTLTDGQRAVGEQISAELAAGAGDSAASSEGPMHRLLQGEVGSGKTLVALRAMLQVIDSGGQAALLAPTEVLAAQHYQSIRKTLGPLAEAGMLGGDEQGTQLALLTGTMNTAAKKASLLAAASGQAGIVIGTHALLSDQVQFFDLGLIVVDEQHRFGVEQRDALRLKAAHPPHLLVMTATPIPRTVAMTVFGDLETSVLKELPAGRAPISSFVVGLAENPGWSRRIWQRSREEIDAGHQVYVVCPRIGEQEGSEAASGDEPEDSAGESRELTSVIEMVEQLRREPSLVGCRIEALHGKLDPAEKSRVMADFAAGLVHVLVSTTVIEVGVDVPNATLMVIMDADRFGISQLHQLRGRVGRGGLPGTALLVTELEPEHPSRRRIDAVAATTDGFALSQEDLKLRREGDILGASQSGGRSALRLLRVLDHEELIEQARADASALIAADPTLSAHPDLEEAIEASLNPEKEAFLERG